MGIPQTVLPLQSFTIESAHENNEILLEINLDLLHRALRMAGNLAEMKMVLTKVNDMPMLGFRMTMMSSTGVKRPVVHNIPILLFAADEIALHQSPVLPLPEVNIYMPHIKSLRTVVDRMKSLSDRLELSANQSGELTLKVETRMASVRTSYSGLENPQWKEGQVPDGSGSQTDFRTCVVDAKKLSRFLGGQYITTNPNRVLLSLAPEKSVILFLLLDHCTITFHLPVLADA
jgi:HUS1 checkpoint protein